MAESTALREKRKQLQALQQKVAKVFDEAGTDRDWTKVKALGEKQASGADWTTESRVAAVKALGKEMNDVFDEVKSLTELDGLDSKSREMSRLGPDVIHADPDVTTPEGRKAIAFSQQFGESPLVKAKLKHAPIHFPDADLKTLMSTSAGWAPESMRSGRLLLDAQRPIEITDLIPSGSIDQALYKYMEETTFTNNAAEVAQAGTYGEAAFALTERSDEVEKIGVWLPVTDEQLEDVPGIRQYIDTRLVFMVRQRADSQLINGDGVTPNILGFLAKPSIQTYAKAGADSSMDAIYKAMTLVRVTGRANPTAIILNPNDWQSMRLLRTADGVYIMGSPTDPGIERLWGLPVVQTSAIVENTGLIGDFVGHSLFLIKRGLDVQITNSHSTYFVEGKQAIRVDFRAVLVIFRPEAFCTATSI